MQMWKAQTVGLVFLLTYTGPLARADNTISDYQDPKLSAAQRAADLVSRMTLEEKAGQLRSDAPAIGRLGVPEYNWWSEGLHGVARAGIATVFPQAIGMAATFDSQLVGTVADVIATEFRAKYREKVGANGGSRQYRGLNVWSPNINIFRDPRWGRGQETYGEDPYLTGRLGVSFIHGLQGDDPQYFKTLATAKHYAVHSGPEADRHREDVHPSLHDLVDTYLPAFHDAVTEANVQAVMCSYNAVDGIPACANKSLLHDYLQGQWGFKGHVVSDCGAVEDFIESDAHHYSNTSEQAVASAITAGMDLICGNFGADHSADAKPIIDAVKMGLIEEAAIDRAATRLFEARIRLGLFNPSSSRPFSEITAADNDTPAHRAVARKTAEASMVLLKNTGLLPLKGAPSHIVVIGPNADSVDALVGNYNGTPSKPVTVLAGLRARFPSSQISYVEGSGLVEAPMEAVPDDALCEDSGCTVKGVRQEQYRGSDLAGEAISSSSVTNVASTWGRPKREDRNASTRWRGFVVPRETGDYQFDFTGSAKFRVYVDGKLAIDAWSGAVPGKIAVVNLKAGQSYALQVEAEAKGSRGDQRLLWSRPSTGADAAVIAAQKADLIVFVGGLTAKLEGEQMPVRAAGFAEGDRTSLDLPASQENLLKRLHATGKPMALVLMNGSALSVNWADGHLPAIVEAWYPGEEGGTAVASLLAGDFSPAGRLPVTFYNKADDLPPFKDYAMAGRTYRYFQGVPLYPFGYGLSFTRFRYEHVAVSTAVVPAGQSVDVSATVRNTGARDGDEVVQLYVTSSSPGAAVRTLVGIQRITVKAGEARKVHFSLSAKAMSTVTPEGRRTIEPGALKLWMGGAQPVTRPGLAKPDGAALTLKVSGRADLPAF